MQKNEKLTSSGFQHGIDLAYTVLQIHKYETETVQMHQIFNKQFEHIDTICDADSAYEAKT